MSKLKDALAEKIEQFKPRTERLLKEFGQVKVDEVSISQVIGGMRDIKCLVTDISYLDPIEGIRFRGYTIPEVLSKLPRTKGSEMPNVAGHFYLLLTGDIPTMEDVESVNQEFRKRKRIPHYVYDILRSFPRDAHPMTMFSAAVLSMQRESFLAKAYDSGKATKHNAWEFMYEDCMDLIAKLPEIGAYIYRMKYKGDTPIPSNPDLDFGDDFAHMMGIDSEYADCMRLYFILHSDHESGNVSAHTCHLVASALSDAYYSFSACLDGLAGPLHGLANQEVLKWIQRMVAQFGNKIPTREEVRQYCWDTLKSGHVIPGFGHAVLRKTDPRYMAQREWCLKHLPDDDLFKVVDLLYQLVPDVLLEQGKAKNPWPNVDAHSGVLQWHYGVTEYEFYTVMFGIGRALGVLANIIWDRALGYPIERPKSITTDMLEEIAGIKKTS
jgi:citrate synthase